MKEQIGKSLSLGLGALVLTKEKAEAFANELIEKGDISKDDAPSFVRQVMDRAEEETAEIEKKLEAMHERTMDRFGVVTKKDIEKMDEKLDTILRELSKDEKESGKGSE